MLATAQPFQTVYKDDWEQEACQSSKLPIGSLKLETFKEEQGENTNCINSVVYHKNNLSVSCVVSNQYLMLQWALLGFRNTVLKVQSTQRIKNNLCMSC